MSMEPRRLCGFRKVGGTYLMSTDVAQPCDRLPFPLNLCPTCGQGIKMTRAYTWIDVPKLFGGVHDPCVEHCMFCAWPERISPAGLLWIGEKFYHSIAAFNNEALQLGICRRIKAVPRKFHLGRTWILLAHAKACKDEEGEKAGIFRTWLPARIEKLFWESDRYSNEVQLTIAQGIIPIFVRDGDRDHEGTVYDEQILPLSA